MKKDSYYMHLHTGSVATGEEWQEEIEKNFCEVERSTTEQEIEEWGAWKEVER